MAGSWSTSAWRAVDDCVVRAVHCGMRDLLGVQLSSAPATRGLPAVDSPTPVVLASVMYIASVGGGWAWIRAAGIKPRRKEPLVLRLLVIVHNSFCLLLSLYTCIGIVYQAFRLRYKLWNNAYNPDHTEMGRLIYLFYISKYFEFMDTVIMLLKRNIRQITLLHVYHHCSIALIWWVIAHHAPGGEAYFSAALNSAVHVVMYFYYLLSAILRNNTVLRQKYLYWGKYLTQIQMLQFAINMVQAQYDLKVEASYPRFLILVLYYYMISLLLLFGNFYLNKYKTVKMA